MKRIDLKSRDPRIEEVDFMSFPVPEEVSSPFKDFVDGEKFDLISLSLVLNFFPSPQARYEMLKRTKLFLRQKSESERLPMLFVVLPLPCVANSRYLTRERFLDIMASLGYHLLHSKESKRMAYWLFQWSGRVEERAWKKEILNDGRGRNNFAICNN